MGRVSLKPKSQPPIDSSAPAGGGGPGNFREPFSLNEDGSPSPSIAHPKGPENKLWVAQAGATPPNTSGKAAKPKPPPTTSTKITSVKSENTSTKDIDIKVQVLADGSSSSITSTSAKTSFSFGTVAWNTPAYDYQDKGGKKIITRLNGKFTFKGTITIQTVYGSSAKATDMSEYGRGTTNIDKKNGHVTLGFHEHCHQQDYLKHLKNKPLPTLNLKVGMSVDQYNKRTAQFNTDYNKYQKDMETSSYNATDEVGYKLSKCKQDGKC